MKVTTKTQKLTIIYLICFLLLLIVSGTIGVYSLGQTYDNTVEYIEVIDMSRKTQLEIQKQFSVWKQTVLEGDRFDQFKKNFHQFSYHSTYIQNYLANLRLYEERFPGISNKINRIILEHNSVTHSYVNLLIKLEKNNFRNKDKIIHLSERQDLELLKKMEAIVDYIEKNAWNRAAEKRNYYIIMVIVSLFVIIITAAGTGSFAMRKLLMLQNTLEDRIEARTRELREAKEKVESSYTRLQISEGKYKILVEGSSDLICALDFNFNLISMNQALLKMFKVSAEDILGKSIIDLIYDNTATGIIRNTVREKLKLLLEKGTPIELKIPFKSPLLIEPIEMILRLEKITIKGDNEILIRGNTSGNDNLLNSLVESKQKYKISNSLLTANDMTYRLTRNAAPFCDQETLTHLRIGIREMLINAIEHGNLEVTFDEKSTALTNDEYFKFISDRQDNPVYKKRKVTVESSITSERAVFIVRDEGRGFDHKSALADEDKFEPSAIAHGRGITMAAGIFDLVKYNDPGNQVMLMKKFSQP